MSDLETIMTVFVIARLVLIAVVAFAAGVLVGWLL